MGQQFRAGLACGRASRAVAIINQLSIGHKRKCITGTNKIWAELDALQAEVDALKRLQAATAAELDALLPALLDRAFKGEL